MMRDRFLVFGLLTVTLTAVVKTLLVNAYVGQLAERGPLMLGLVFIGLWLMTAALASVVFIVISRSVDAKRRARIANQVDNDPGKENMMTCHAHDWGLTKAETDVAIMVVKGFSNAEIAAMRGSALQTVKSQLSAIYLKSGLEGRYQLIAFITDEVCETSRACGLDNQTPASQAAPARSGPRLVVDRRVAADRRDEEPVLRRK